LPAKTVGKTVGKFSLEDLDVFRFETAPTKYQSAGKKPVIPERGDILRLVEWKLYAIFICGPHNIVMTNRWKVNMAPSDPSSWPW
jgi:hypothetical protein